MRKTWLPLFVSCLFLAIVIPANAVVILPSVVTHNEPAPAEVKKAVADFKSLSRKERKEKVKAVKKEIRKFRAEKKAGKKADTDTLLLVIIAILLPPLAVYLYEDEINNRFWISLLLTILFWLPGVIYALVLILGEH